MKIRKYAIKAATRVLLNRGFYDKESGTRVLGLANLCWQIQ